MNTFLSKVPDLSEFAHYAAKQEVATDDGLQIEVIVGNFYKREVEGRVETCGLFTYKEKPLYIAWGYQDEKHCSAHAVMGKNGLWQEVILGCPVKHALLQDGKCIGIKVGGIPFLFT